MPDAASALALAERTLALCNGADQAQVSVTFTRRAYARFAQNYVTQNLDALQPEVNVTFVRAKRLGTATSAELSDAGLRAVVETARASTSRLPPNPEFVSLAAPATIASPPKSFFPATANASPDERIDLLLPVFQRMRGSSLRAAGFATTGSNVRAVANSLGVRAAFEGSIAGLEIKAMAPDVSGYAQRWSRDRARIDAAERAELAAQKATLSATPADFAPGTYTVVLEAPAFLECLAGMLEGMEADAVLE
ncbi:MAG: hypothetical protein JO140_02655, partial [Candidatus Eremiobacteraeota bacterium]|nr:hypothetical protein [Candidatus Eremiobacteraeota bacterium]